MDVSHSDSVVRLYIAALCQIGAYSIGGVNMMGKSPSRLTMNVIDERQLHERHHVSIYSGGGWCPGAIVKLGSKLL